MTTLCDAGPLYALVNKNERDQHARCRALLPATVPLLTTWPCLAEAMYLADRAGGWPMQRLLWELLSPGILGLHSLSDGEAARMRALMEKYRDTPMDLADASLVAAAESLGVRRIFTLDSDFYVYRLADGAAFEVMP